KKPGSSLRACIQPFCHSLLYLSQRGEMGTITQGSILNFYGNCREDLKRTLYIMYILELLDKTLLEHMPFPALYKIVLEILDYFNESGLNLLAVRYFETILLSNLGYKPVLDRCVCCDARTDLAAFSIPEGGMVCSGCRLKLGFTTVLPGEIVALLKLFSSSNLKTVTRVKTTASTMKQLEVFLEQYLEYHLERKFYVKNTIKTLKKSIKLPD
ncbi:MAG TPA: DNA repair protein RecO, partial [Syntrophomonadaceae bacterium]|nr:DNA repair protein RecO [Syntrophomonadaceae bacterium]